MTPRDWYDAHGCNRAHCPCDCEHSQPFIDDSTGDLICGRCWFLDGERTLMVPCLPAASAAPAAAATTAGV